MAETIQIGKKAKTGTKYSHKKKTTKDLPCRQASKLCYMYAFADHDKQHVIPKEKQKIVLEVYKQCKNRGRFK